MAPLEQVFLYVTQQCNIRCDTCYALEQLERGTDLHAEDVRRLLRALRAEGAWRLTLLGGEPTVYPPLRDLVGAAREMGFRFVRINTNGMCDASLFQDARLRGVDVICFSVDGATAAVNDSIRTGSRLERVVANMRRAAECGFDVRANVTITSRNVTQIFDVIALVQDAGGLEVNLNVLFLMGSARNHPELSVSPDAWRRTYSEVMRRHRQFSIRIKLPPAFAALDELTQQRDKGHHCLAQDRSRLYVTSHGDAYPCPVLLDDPSHRSATYSGGTMVTRMPPVTRGVGTHDFCHFIKMQTDGFLPLCIFHKERLNWQGDAKV